MNTIKKLFSKLGPGFITGASDDDPSGIATYSQTGALFGFGQLWTALFSFPLMTAVQEMCGRIGLVTGQGLAGVIKKNYSKKLLFFSVFLLFIANTINIGADLGAMAASAQLVYNIPFIFWITGMVVLTLGLEIFVSYKVYARYLKFLTFALFSYFITAFIIHVNWQDVFLSTVIPSMQLNKDYLINILAIFGTTISPYLFFWQASEEVEEEIAHHKLRRMGAGVPKVTPKDITNLKIDTIFGMFFSNIVMWFIIITTGATLHAGGITNIHSASEAASALKPFAGEFSSLVFALGIIGTGLLAVPILAGSASYAVSESFDWNAGLYKKLKSAHGFYGAITLATLLGLLINFIGIDPIQVLYYTAVVNGIIAPPLLIVILLIANNKKIMKEKVNGVWLNVLGITTVVIMGISSILLFMTFFQK